MTFIEECFSNLIQKSLNQIIENIKLTNKSCFYDYSIYNEDKQNYSLSWSLDHLNTVYSIYSENVLAAFNFTKSSNLKEKIYFGEYTQYTGGGYVYMLNPGSITVKNDLLALQQSNWIDKRTRAVFIEFTLYNPNLNLFSFCEMLFEIIPSGNILPRISIIPASLWSTDREVAITGCLACYLVVITILMTVEIRSIKKNGLRYYAQFWSLLDWTLFALSWTALPMYLYKLYASYEIINQIGKNSIRASVNLSTLPDQNEILGIMLAICSFINTIKTIRLLRFDSNLEYLIKTIRKCTSCLTSFMLVFFIIWFAYVQLMYLLYNQISYGYSTFVKSMKTCILFLFGGPAGSVMECLKMNYTLGAIILTTYMCTIIMFLYNIMIVIIGETFSSTRLNAKSNKNKSLIEHLKSKLKNNEQENMNSLKYYEVCDIFKIRSIELINRLKNISQVDHQISRLLIHELIDEAK